MNVEELHTSTIINNRVKLRVWIDFVCPFCLIGKELISNAIDGLNIEIEWMPFELREYPTPTLRPEDEYLPKIWKQSVYPVAKQLGVDIRLPTISPQPYTRNAFLLFYYAIDHNKGDEYVDTTLRAFFQQNRDIGKSSVLQEIMMELGLDSSDFEAVLRSSKYAKLHDATLQEARNIGINSVPSIGIGDLVISGIPNEKYLREMLLKQLG